MNYLPKQHSAGPPEAQGRCIGCIGLRPVLKIETNVLTLQAIWVGHS